MSWDSSNCVGGMAFAMELKFKVDTKHRKDWFTGVSFSHPAICFTHPTICDIIRVWKLSIKLISRLALYVVNPKRGEPKLVVSVLAREEGQSYAEIMLSRYVNTVSVNFLFPCGVKDRVVGLSALGNVLINI